MSPTCERCGGKGHIPVNENTVRECICAYAKKVREHLGPVIASVAAPESSPLFVPGVDGGPPVRDLTKQNLILRSSRPAILPHIKWALTFKGLNFRFLEVTDQRVFNVWLGKESYLYYPPGIRETVPTYNTLSDLVGSQHDLVIVYLGYHSAKVAQAGAVVYEALMVRESQCAPTWVVDDPRAPFGPGHNSYNAELARYIETHYREVSFLRPGQGCLPSAGSVKQERRQAEPTTGPEQYVTALQALLANPSDVLVGTDADLTESSLGWMDANNLYLDPNRTWTALVSSLGLKAPHCKTVAYHSLVEAGIIIRSPDSHIPVQKRLGQANTRHRVLLVSRSFLAK